MQSKRVKLLIERLTEAAWPECRVYLGNGHCEHGRLFSGLRDPGLPDNFTNIFDAEPSNKPVARQPLLVPMPTAPPLQPKNPKSVCRNYDVGDVIAGRYRVQQVFEGGMGFVYVVEDPERIFVLKAPKQSLTDETPFVREAQAWVRMGFHPNIVPAFGVDRPAGMLSVAAEYIAPGENGVRSLREAVQIQPVPLPQLLKWGADFCYGMQHALANGLSAHCDIKPDNLLLDAEGKLRITDFGIARAAAQGVQGARMQIAGTPPYMPPEQWRGIIAGFRTDVYAFGVVLYELAFGHSPWLCMTQQQFRQAHLEHIPDVPMHPLKQIIDRALAKNAADRFADPGELLAALAAMAAERQMPMPLPPELPDRERDALFAKSTLSLVGDRTIAIAAAQELTQRWPDFAPGWTQLGRLYLEQDLLGPAKQAILKSLDVDPTRSPAWNNLGIIFGAEHNERRAIEAFRMAISWDGLNVGAMSSLGGALAVAGKAEEGIEILERAVKIAPDNPYYLINLSEAHRIAGNLARADTCRSAGLGKLPPQEREMFARRLADVMRPEPGGERLVNVADLLRRGDFETAMPLLLNFVRDEPENPKGWHNLAMAWFDQKNWSEACSAWQRLLALEPTNAVAMKRLGQCAMYEQRWAEAQQWCSQLSAQLGRKVDAILLKADIFAAQQELDQARRLLMKAMDEHPRDVRIREKFGDQAMKGGAPFAALSKGYKPAMLLLAGREDSAHYRIIERKLRRAAEAARRDAENNS